MLKMVIALAVMLALAAPSPVLAQKKMYRCGSQYQDRPCEGPKQPASSAAGKPAEPSRSASEQRKQIRCENYSRVLDEFREKERVSGNAEVAKGIAVQRRVVEGRIREEGC